MGDYLVDGMIIRVPDGTDPSAIDTHHRTLDCTERFIDCICTGHDPFCLERVYHRVMEQQEHHDQRNGTNGGHDEDPDPWTYWDSNHDNLQNSQEAKNQS